VKTVLHGPQGIRITLDTNEIIPDDPGAGTPVLVELGSESSTYDYAVETGEVGLTLITSKQNRWLEAVRDQVEAFKNEHKI
jgi:hypothetical protein